MRTILLAAGRSGLTEGPVCNIKVGGFRLLDLQVSCLRKAGADQITVVTGHAANEVSRADIDIRRNDCWQETGSVKSLVAASDLFDGTTDVLIAYGDTLFDASVIQSILSSNASITAVGLNERKIAGVDTYREYGKLLPDGGLAGVSQVPARDASHFVFTGLLLVKKAAAQDLKSFLVESPIEAFAHLGGLANALVRSNRKVAVSIINGGWAELDTANQLENVLQDTVFVDNIVQIHVDWRDRAKRYDKLDWVNNDKLLSGILDVAKTANAKKLIDLGTGTGKVLVALQDILKVDEAWGVDSSQAMLDKIEKRPGLNLKCENCETMESIPSGYFDLATARMVFHHINDTAKAMESIHRILRDDGMFILCEGVPPTLRTVKWYTEMFRFKEDRKTLTEVDLINLLLRAGFENVQTRTIVMKNASLNNWLDNSGIPEQNIRILKDMHHNAPSFVKDDYEMKFENGDCLMTWRFAVTFGNKPRA